MSASTSEEGKPVPRAEKERFIPCAKRVEAGEEDWWISLAAEHVFVMSEKDGNWYISESGSRYNVPSGYLIALIESAKLREELAEARGSVARLMAENDRLARERGDFRVKLDQASGMDEELDGLEQRNKDLREDLDTTFREKDEMWANGNRVATALGLPEGADVEAVLRRIGEIRELSEARLKLIGVTQRENFELQGMVSDRKYLIGQLATLGAFIGHPGATPAHVVSETVSWLERLKASDVRYADFIQKLRRIAGTSAAADRGTVVGAVETWKKRALAAEAKLAGGPDESREAAEARWVEDGARDKELRRLRRFFRVVRRMHGIPQSAEDSEALDTIAGYLDCAEKWRQAARQTAYDPAKGKFIRTAPHNPFSGD